MVQRRSACRGRDTRSGEKPALAEVQEHPGGTRGDGVPEPQKEDRAFLSRERLSPPPAPAEDALQNAGNLMCRSNQIQPLRMSSEKALDFKNECSRPHSTEQVSIFFSFI